MIDKATIAEWRKEQGNGMTSALGEYTPPEFWELLDDYEAQAKRIADIEAVVAKAETLYKSIGSHDSGRKWVAQKYIDDLGFALSDIKENID